MKKPFVVAMLGLAAVVLVSFASPNIIKSHAATALLGDINGDGKVDIFDLSILLSNYGKTSSTPTPVATATATPPTTATPVKTPLSTPNPPGPGITLFADDFNHGAACSNFFTAGWNQCHQAAPDRMAITTVAGRRALVMKACNGDTNTPKPTPGCTNPINNMPTANPRAQLNTKTIMHEGDEVMMTWGTRFESDVPFNAPWHLFIEFYGPPYNGTPVMDMAIDAGKMCWKGSCMPDALQHNVWYDIQAHIKFSTNASVGFVEYTVNGVKMNMKTGGTRFNGATMNKAVDGANDEFVLTNYRIVNSAPTSTID